MSSAAQPWEREAAKIHGQKSVYFEKQPERNNWLWAAELLKTNAHPEVAPRKWRGDDFQ